MRTHAPRQCPCSLGLGLRGQDVNYISLLQTPGPQKRIEFIPLRTQVGKAMLSRNKSAAQLSALASMPPWKQSRFAVLANVLRVRNNVAVVIRYWRFVVIMRCEFTGQQIILWRMAHNYQEKMSTAGEASASSAHFCCVKLLRDLLTHFSFQHGAVLARSD